jgi:Fur family transcriptional regulator, ferric uptake regulator
MKKETSTQATAALVVAELSITKPRVHILSYLMEVGHPVSIDDLQKKVGSSVNYVTFYRVLKQLVAKGIVHQLDFREGKAYYEYQSAEHHHHHISCMQCGSREETLDCHEQDDYSHVLKHSKQFSHIASHTLEFFGVCKRCSK